MLPHCSLSVAVATALAASISAQVTLTEIATVDLSSTSNPANVQYIGSNPSAIAWNGTQLFVAGYNNNAPGTNVNCGIVEVTAPLSGTPGFGSAFGVVNTPGFRGYSGLDIAGSLLAAAYDDGTANANGITAHDLTGLPQWAKTARGGSGTGFDPGTPTGTAAGQGVAWTTFGSGRRALQDAANGSDIWTTANGMVILTSQGTFWRDVDFDDATGDIWLREGNNVIRGTRSGDNALAGLSVPFDPTDADSINMQNLAFCGTPSGAFVLFNDRGSALSNQGFTQTVKAIRPDGSALTLDFGAFAPATGNAAYDFSYDAASNTVAILDFANRNAHIFQVTYFPYFAYGSGCRGSYGLTPELAASGPGTIGSTLTYQIAQGVPNGQGFLILGFVQGSLPLYAGCDILVSPILPVTLGPIALDGTGAGSTNVTILAGVASGASLTAQGIMIDAGLGGTLPFVLTNGVQLIIP